MALTMQEHCEPPFHSCLQLEMVYSGKLHGFMRMYWAKKILEVHRRGHSTGMCSSIFRVSGLYTRST